MSDYLKTVLISYTRCHTHISPVCFKQHLSISWMFCTYPAVTMGHETVMARISFFGPAPCYEYQPHSEASGKQLSQMLKSESKHSLNPVPEVVKLNVLAHTRFTHCVYFQESTVI